MSVKTKNDLRLDFMQKHKVDVCINDYHHKDERWSVFVPTPGIFRELEFFGATLRQAIDKAIKVHKEDN